MNREEAIQRIVEYIRDQGGEIDGLILEKDFPAGRNR